MKLGRKHFPWRPKWRPDPAPCGGGNCTPQNPSCRACIDAAILFNYQTGRPESDWPLLAEWQRESWRREVME